MGLGGVAIATLPSVICAKLMFSDGLGGDCYRERNQQLKANFVQLLLVAEFVSSGIYAQKDEEQHCEAPQR